MVAEWEVGVSGAQFLLLKHRLVPV